MFSLLRWVHCLPVSGYNIVDGITKVLFETLMARNFQFVRIKAQQMINGGMNISDIVRVLDCVIAQLIGCPIYHATLDTSSSHPDTKSK